MKKILFIFAILLGIFAFSQTREDLKNMTPEQRREFIKNLSPEQKRQLLDKVGVEIAIRNLEIPQDKQEEFKKLFAEYMANQKAIHKKFKLDFDQGNLSDADAKKRLNDSFDVAQQLLNNKKLYAEKFQKILSPQQVLRLFQMEKKMHDKMRERRGNQGPPKGRGPRSDEMRLE